MGFGVALLVFPPFIHIFLGRARRLGPAAGFTMFSSIYSGALGYVVSCVFGAVSFGVFRCLEGGLVYHIYHPFREISPLSYKSYPVFSSSLVRD